MEYPIVSFDLVLLQNYVQSSEYVQEPVEPVSQLSDFYKNILTIACNRPYHVIKNSSDFMEKVKNVNIPKHHIMATLDVVSSFPSVPYEFVKNSIKKRWKDIKKHTKMSFKEFMKGLDILMNSLYFQNDQKYYKPQSL